METKKIKPTKGQEFLQSYLATTGISVADLAKQVGVTRQFIYYVLDGKHQIGVDTARKIHEKLGIPYNKII